MLELKKVVVCGAPGKDVQIKIDDVKKLPPPFQKHLKRTVGYSKIPEAYGPEWSIERALEELNKRLVQPIYYSYGGRAPHVAYGIAKLGGKAVLVTVFGEDYDKEYDGFFGGGYWSHLKKSGVEMSLLEVEVPEELFKEPAKLREYLLSKYGDEIHRASVLKVVGRETSTIVCVKDREGMDFYYIDDVRGASAIELGRPAPREVLGAGDIVFVTTSEASFMEDAVNVASQLGKEVMMDIAVYTLTHDIVRRILPKVHIVFGNPLELKFVTDAFGIKRVDEIFDVTDTGLPKLVIQEDKFEGFIVALSREGEAAKAGPIPLDKTGNSVGCCDGMAAGFLALYQRGADIEVCLKAGLVEAASIWEVEGVQEGMLSKEELVARYRKLFGEEAEEVAKILAD